jgi:hypothetical protein
MSNHFILKVDAAATAPESLQQVIESDVFGALSILNVRTRKAGEDAVSLHAPFAEAQLLGPVVCCRFALLGLRTDTQPIVSDVISDEDVVAGCKVFWLEQFRDAAEFEKHNRGVLASPQTRKSGMMPFGLGDLTAHLGEKEGIIHLGYLAEIGGHDLIYSFTSHRRPNVAHPKTWCG